MLSSKQTTFFSSAYKTSNLYNQYRSFCLLFFCYALGFAVHNTSNPLRFFSVIMHSPNSFSFFCKQKAETIWLIAHNKMTTNELTLNDHFIAFINALYLFVSLSSLSHCWVKNFLSNSKTFRCNL